MGRNAAMFEEYLAKQEIALEKNEQEEGNLYVIRENIPQVGPVVLMALFNNNDRIVTLISYQYLKLSRPDNRPRVQELVNRLNTEYTMVKFMESGNAVSAQIVVPFNENFRPEIVVEMITVVLQAMQEEHPRLLEAV